VTLVPEIRDQLHATAQRRAQSAGPARRPARWWRRPAGSVMLALSVLVVAGVLAIILRDGHSLTSGPGRAATQNASTPPSGWGTLNAEAIARAEQQDGACRPRPLTGAVPLRHDAPGQDLTSVLGVLRRPAPASQQISAHALRQIAGGRLVQFARGIYLRYVRHGERNGITYYFVPAANVNQTRAIPDRCYREQLDSFHQLATQRPARQQASLIAYETTSLQQQRMVADHPAGVCLATTGPAGSGTGPCVTAVSLRQFNGTTGDGSYGNNHETVTPRIVPDSIATVTARYRAQTYPGRVPRPLTITQPVVQNLVILTLHGAWDPPSSLTYRSANGSVVWSITRQ
jgi:hypothetical protein